MGSPTGSGPFLVWFYLDIVLFGCGPKLLGVDQNRPAKSGHPNVPRSFHIPSTDTRRVEHVEYIKLLSYSYRLTAFICLSEILLMGRNFSFLLGK